MDDIWQRAVLKPNLLNNRGTFQLALSAMSQRSACLLGWPIQSLSFLKNTDKLYFPFPRHRLPKLFFHSFRTLYESPAYNSLAAYLCNPTQKITQLEQDLFCGASQYCLEQLCTHNRATLAPPVVTSRLRHRRIHLPWKWRRRNIREYVGGPTETPWMWLQSEPAVGIFKYYLYPRRRDIVSGTYLGKVLKRPVDPFRCIRQRMERYHLWLRYVPLLLRRAGFSDDLVAICAHKRLSGMSQEFPVASRKARRAMTRYVESFKNWVSVLQYYHLTYSCRIAMTLPCFLHSTTYLRCLHRIGNLYICSFPLYIKYPHICYQNIIDSILNRNASNQCATTL